MAEGNWERMMFKGHKVWVSVDDNQQPKVRSNKLLIKYQLDQEHEYWVRRDGVEPIDPSRMTKKPAAKKRPGPSKSPRPHEALPGEPSTGAVHAYTDGACSGNPGPAGIGVVLRYGSKDREISRHIGIATNNVAELTAIKAALEAIRTRHLPVRLYTDSAYCRGLLCLGWKPKRNEELVASTRKLMDEFEDLKILKVQAHVGIEENERADRLARQAAGKTTSGTKKA
jgi:ribonuclease HI